MGRAIVITSGKGGVGKTTACANIGYALAKKGQEVLLIDTDLGLRNLDTVLGLENRVVFDIVDVVENKCRIKQAIIRDKRNEHLSLLPASQTRDKNALNEEQMKNLLSELKNQYDYILIDCPAGIEQGFKNAIAGADEALVICTPEVSSVRDADRVIGIMASNGISKIDLVINRIKPELVRSGDMLSKDDVEDILCQKAIGVIVDDSGVVRATNLGEAAVNLAYSKAGKEYENIAGRLMGERIPIATMNPIGAFLDKILFKKTAV
jgi:septum site-determining protein MinD